MEFGGKVTVITGGGGALARVFASALAERGAQLGLLDVDEKLATEAVSALEERGYKAFGSRCDVTDEHDVEQKMKQIHEQYGRIDILINTAALHRQKYNQPFATLERDDVRAMFDVNVMGILNCSLAAQPYMASLGGGVIINIASTAGNTSCTPYGVSKLAARGLTVALAYELSGDNIRVNGISPGFVGSAGALADRTPGQLMALLTSQGVRLPETVLSKCSTQDLIDIFMSLHLTKREGTPNDVVAALLYLCSDDAGFVTGETLKIAGGSALGF